MSEPLHPLDRLGALPPHLLDGKPFAGMERVPSADAGPVFDRPGRVTLQVWMDPAFPENPISLLACPEGIDTAGAVALLEAALETWQDDD